MQSKEPLQVGQRLGENSREGNDRYRSRNVESQYASNIFSNHRERRQLSAPSEQIPSQGYVAGHRESSLPKQSNPAPRSQPMTEMLNRPDNRSMRNGNRNSHTDPQTSRIQEYRHTSNDVPDLRDVHIVNDFRDDHIGSSNPRMQDDRHTSNDAPDLRDVLRNFVMAVSPLI